MSVNQAVSRLGILCGVLCLAFVVLCNNAHSQSENVDELSSILESTTPKLHVPPHSQSVDNVYAFEQATPLNDFEGCNCSASGPECAQGCQQCVPGRKSKCACRKANRQQRKSPVLGLNVEEVQYGANAGYPSFGYVSHGPWYNGPTFGPGRGKLAELKNALTSRKSKRRAKRQDNRRLCRQCSEGYH